MKTRLLWGAIWGIPFTMTVRPSWQKLYLAGILYSLLPTMVQLFYIFPCLARKGLLGVQLGRLTFLMVLSFNIIWGLILAGTLRFTAGEK